MSSNRVSRLAVLTAAALFATGSVADSAAPDEVIAGAVDELTEKLDGRKDELAEDKDALYALINDILLPRFDRKLAAQLVLAKHWRDASDEQKERFINAFYNSLLQKYADGLLEFDPDRIEVGWIGGGVDVVEDVEVDRLILITEGTGTVGVAAAP